MVVLSHKIYVYNFTDLKLVDHIETMKNENGSCCLRLGQKATFTPPDPSTICTYTGIVALCASSTHMVLACPGIIKGQVRVEVCPQIELELNLGPDYPLSLHSCVVGSCTT